VILDKSIELEDSFTE